jgi:outer membrane protein OmpA-like peptidoglycan-associated protein
MKRLLIALLITATTGLSSGCIASRKFVRNEVKTSSDALNGRIDTTDGEIKETRDHVDRVDQRVTDVDGRVTGVDGRVTALDSRTTEGMNSLKGDVNAVDTKADRTNNDLAGLDQRFQNRNNFSVAAEQSVPFKFDSAKLDPDDMAALDEIAGVLMQNPDAIIVLEGHTDATGDHEYNVKLGERRVDAVRRYLAVEKNVPVYRIHEISFGAARPIAPNSSRDGREKNRTVTMTVLVPSTEQAAAANQ